MEFFPSKVKTLFINLVTYTVGVYCVVGTCDHVLFLTPIDELYTKNQLLLGYAIHRYALNCRFVFVATGMNCTRSVLQLYKVDYYLIEKISKPLMQHYRRRLLMPTKVC